MYNLKSILYGDINNIEIIGQQYGEEYEKASIPNCLITLNPNQPNYKETLQQLKKMNINLNECIVIDKKTINNDDVMRRLIDESCQKSINLRIVDKERLSPEEEQKLSTFRLIYTKEQGNNKNIFCVTTSENVIIDDNIYIKENIVEEDIINLTRFINDTTIDENIYFKFHNLKRSISIINRMKDLGLKPNCKITIYGYLLEDNTSDLDNINELQDYDISVTYTTCKDMISKYSEEPYISGNYYYSELEGGGNTNIYNYYKMINILENEEKHIKTMNYSPLEAMVYGYNYLKENYVYDDDYKTTDSINTLTNRAIDFIVNRDKMVCEGYSTLYSALMRRCGIPNFRYSSFKHVKNIARIKDDKYNIDTIGVFDPTNDSCYIENGKRKNLYSYEHFGISPQNTTRYKTPDILSIPYTLCIDWKEITKYGKEYYSDWDKDFVYDYLPAGFTARMLELMGYEYEEKNIKGFFNLIYDLNRTNKFQEIEIVTIYKALLEVLRKEGKLTETQLDIMTEEFSNSINNRILNYSYVPSIRDVNGNISRIDENAFKITKCNIEEITEEKDIEMSDAKIEYLKNSYYVDKTTILKYLQELCKRLKEMNFDNIPEDLVYKCLDICCSFESPKFLTPKDITQEKIIDIAINFWAPEYIEGKNCKKNV